MSRIIHRNQSQTPCAGRDEDLLMYLHGALPPMARIRTARHIHRCATCQQRFAALTATSQALADTVRGTALPRWTPPTLPTAPVWLAGGAAILLLAGASFFTVSLWTQKVQAHTANPPSKSSVAVTDEQCNLEESYRLHYGKLQKNAVAQSSRVMPAAKASPTDSPIADASCVGKSLKRLPLAKKY